MLSSISIYSVERPVIIYKDGGRGCWRSWGGVEGVLGGCRRRIGGVGGVFGSSDKFLGGSKEFWEGVGGDLGGEGSEELGGGGPRSLGGVGGVLREGHRNGHRN